MFSIPGMTKNSKSEARAGACAPNPSSAPGSQIFCHAWRHQVLGKAALTGFVYVIGVAAIQLALGAKDKPPPE